MGGADEGIAAVPAKRREAVGDGVAGGGLDDDTGIGGHERLAGRAGRVAPLHFAGDEHGEEDAENGDRQARGALPAFHKVRPIA